MDSTSPSVTVERSWLGTSTPMRLSPGIGARMRIVGAARDRARSSARAVTRFTLTPGAMRTRKSVTVGPGVQPVTSAGMSNVPSVPSILRASSLSSTSLALCTAALAGVWCSNVSGGSSKPSIAFGATAGEAGTVGRDTSGSGSPLRRERRAAEGSDARVFESAAVSATFAAGSPPARGSVRFPPRWPVRPPAPAVPSAGSARDAATRARRFSTMAVNETPANTMPARNAAIAMTYEMGTPSSERSAQAIVPPTHPPCVARTGVEN